MRGGHGVECEQGIESVSEDFKGVRGIERREGRDANALRLLEQCTANP